MADVCAMEIPKEAPALLDIIIDNSLHSLPLERIWDHMTHCIVKEKKNAPGNFILFGFHHYGTRSCDVTAYENGTLVKMGNVWVYSQDDIDSFHTGVVFCAGTSSEKTFFPSKWTKTQILKCIESAAKSARCYDKKMHDWGREHIYEADIEHNVKLRFILYSDHNNKKMRLISVYPLVSGKKNYEHRVAGLKNMRLDLVRMPEPTKKPLKEDNESIQALMKAAKKGELDELCTLQENGVCLTTIDNLGNTALHCAMESQNYCTILFLLNDQLINRHNKAGQTPLIKAISRRDAGIVGLLINYGADVNLADSCKQTPLMHVIRLVREYPDDAVVLARVLLQAGAQSDIKDSRGTALMQALEFDKAEKLIHTLLDFGADYLTIKDYKGRTALEIDSKKTGYIRGWIEKKERWKKDHEASEFQYLVQSGHRSQVEKELRAKTGTSKDLESGLLCALENADEKMAELLLRAGAASTLVSESFFADRISKNLQSLLKKRKEEIEASLQQENEKKKLERKASCERLIKHIQEGKLDVQDLSALVDFKNVIVSKDGCTPFLFAVRTNKHLVVEQMLKQHVVNIHAVDNTGRDALTIAYDNNDSAMFGLLLLATPLQEKNLYLLFEKVLNDESKTHESKKSFMDMFARKGNSVKEKFKDALRRGDTHSLNLLKNCAQFLGSQITSFAFEALFEDEHYMKNLVECYPEVLAAKNEKGQNLLTAAAEIDRVDLVESLDQLGISVAKTDDAGKAASMYASPEAKKRIEQYMIEKSARLIAEHKKQEKQRLLALGWPAYAMYAFLDDAQQISSDSDEVQDDSIINKRTPEGDAAINIAVKMGHVNSVTALCKKGADVDSIGSEGLTPIVQALRAERYDIVEELLKAGASTLWKPGATIPCNLYLENKKMPKALKDKIRQARFTNLEVASQELCLQNFALEDQSLKDAFLQFSQLELISIVSQLLMQGAPYAADLCEYLKKCGITLVNDETTSLLAVAAIANDERVVNFLLDEGANVDAITEPIGTPLLAVCSARNVAMIRLLLKRGASINLIVNGASALIHAAANGLSDAVQVLLEYGADLDATCINNQTALSSAVKNEDVTCASMILVEYKKRGVLNLNKIPVIEALFDACQTMNEQLIKVFLDHGVPAEIPYKNGLHPFMTVVMAAKNHPIEVTLRILDLFVAHKVNIDTKNGADKVTPLIYSVYQNQIHVVKYLLKKGALVDSVQSNGSTALHFAAYVGSSELIKLLLDSGASVDSLDGNGFTPLALAFKYQAPAVAQLLILAGANVNIRMDTGSTPLHFAVHDGNEELVKSLLEKGADVYAADAQGHTPMDVATQVLQTGRRAIGSVSPRIIVDMLLAAKTKTHK